MDKMFDIHEKLSLKSQKPCAIGYRQYCTPVIIVLLWGDGRRNSKTSRRSEASYVVCLAVNKKKIPSQTRQNKKPETQGSLTSIDTHPHMHQAHKYICISTYIHIIYTLKLKQVSLGFYQFDTNLDLF